MKINEKLDLLLKLSQNPSSNFIELMDQSFESYLNGRDISEYMNQVISLAQPLEYGVFFGVSQNLYDRNQNSEITYNIDDINNDYDQFPVSKSYDLPLVA